jgi:hypothetical protein
LNLSPKRKRGKSKSFPRFRFGLNSLPPANCEIGRGPGCLAAHFEVAVYDYGDPTGVSLALLKSTMSEVQRTKNRLLFPLPKIVLL